MLNDFWFVEGFMNYYDGLLFVCLGVWSKECFLVDMGCIIDCILCFFVLFFGLFWDMLVYVVFCDWVMWCDLQNVRNIYLYYYFYGEVVGLVFDLMLCIFWEIDFDVVMWWFWVQFGCSEMFYEEFDFEVVFVVEMDVVFVKDFFDCFVCGLEKLDYVRFVEFFGLGFEIVNLGEIWIGDEMFCFGEDGVIIIIGMMIGLLFY